jgi:hypothetical protein
MVNCGVLFEVRSEFLNIIFMSFGFRGLIQVNLRIIGVDSRIILKWILKC